MKILAKYLAVDTQVHVGKCYLIGMTATATKTMSIYNIEGVASLADANKVCWGVGITVMLPKPGIECTNGLYVANSSNPCMVYYSLG